MSNLYPFNEVYFGKTESIIAIENQLDLLRDKYVGTKKKPNNDPVLIKLNRMIEQQFGFGHFSLVIEYDPIPSAFTLPVSYSLNYAKKNNAYNIEKDTYKFKKEMDYTCIVIMSTGLIFSGYFSTEEIMACLMYELGHNFYSCMTKNAGILSSIYNAVSIAEMIQATIATFTMLKNITKTSAAQFEKDFAAQQYKTADEMYTFDVFMQLHPEYKKYENDPNFRKKIENLLKDQKAEFLSTTPEETKKAGDIFRGVGTGISAAVAIDQLFENSKIYVGLQETLKKNFKNNKEFKDTMYSYADTVHFVFKHLLNKALLPALNVFAKIKSSNAPVTIVNIIKAIGIKDILVPYKNFIMRAKNPLTWISLPVKGRVENMATNFATMYGYGPAQISYFDKMKSNNKYKYINHVTNKVPMIGIALDLILAPSKLLNNAFDPSFDGIGGAYNQLKMLKYELEKNNIDPSVARSIKNDIELCEKKIKKVSDISKSVKDPDICRRLYSKCIKDFYKNIGLDEINNFDKRVFDLYDQNYDDKVNGGENPNAR